MCIQMKIFLWLLVGLLVAIQASLGQEAQKPTGTGFVVDANGYLLTCEHVVRDAAKVEVVIGEKTYEAAILVTDEKHDLALLEIKAKGLPSCRVGNSNKVEVGEEVRAFGFPLASVLGTSVKVTMSKSTHCYDNFQIGTVRGSTMKSFSTACIWMATGYINTKSPSRNTASSAMRQDVRCRPRLLGVGRMTTRL
jgi:hypothetical protein